MIVKKNNFNKNVITLISGTSIAQALPIITAPILTRIYSPENFGAFAFYFALVTILSIVATGRYDLAIVLPKIKKTAIQLTLTAIYCSVITSALFIIIILLYSNTIYHDASNTTLYFIPFCVLLTGCYQSLYFFLNREKNYECLARSRVIQSLLMVFLQLLLGAFLNLGSLGLVIGHLLGLFFSLLYLLFYFREEVVKIKIFRPIRIIAILHMYRNFPKFLLLAHSMNASSMQSPAVMLNSIFTATIAGYYLLIQRIVGAPLSIVGGAIGDVFRQQAAEAYKRRGECLNEYRTTFKKLFYLSFFPFTVFAIVAPNLFCVLFGEKWYIAGEYARLLTPMFFLQFITNPLSNMFLIARKQKLDLIWQTILLALTITAFIIADFFSSAKVAIALFSIFYSIMYMVNLYISHKLAQGTEVD